LRCRAFGHSGRFTLLESVPDFCRINGTDHHSVHQRLHGIRVSADLGFHTAIKPVAYPTGQTQCASLARHVPAVAHALYETGDAKMLDDGVGHDGDHGREFGTTATTMYPDCDAPIPLTGLLSMLTGGDRRSIGQANRAAAIALAQPDAMAVLMLGMTGTDPVVRMRCADAAEKASAVQPDLLLAHRQALLGPLAAMTQPEVRWHVASMLVRLPLSATELDQVWHILLGFTQDSSRIVQTAAMQALADLAVVHPHLMPEAHARIVAMMETGSPAVQARGRKLLVDHATATRRRTP